MGGKVMGHEKPELSRKNPYHITKHRYYELKHFCLQYEDWKKALAMLDGWRAHGDEIGGIIKGNIPSNPTEQCAMLRAYYSQRIKLIDDCLALLEPAIVPYLLKGVTEGLSYNQLRARGCPCGSEMYYELYRKFFWLLSRERG